MTTPLRRLLLPLSVFALAVPASAAADTVPVTPLGGSDGSFAAAAKAAADPGCRSSNVIEFRDPTLPPPYAVRHAGRIRCEVPIRSRCHATLFQGDRKVSEIGDRGRNRCRMASSYFGAYKAGAPFRENYSYRLTLRRDGQRWAGTSNFCPKRRNNRRTLICRDSHATVAPQRDAEKHF
jgi:hypothetical protein